MSNKKKRVRSYLKLDWVAFDYVRLKWVLEVGKMFVCCFFCVEKSSILGIPFGSKDKILFIKFPKIIK